MTPLAERMSRLLVESAFDVLSRARALEAQGRDIIHLEIGEPDFETPAHVIEAAKKALDDGFTHYGPTPGLPEFRDTIAEYVSGTRGIPVERPNVIVAPGGKPIIFFPMMALLEPGDEVIYPNPGFPIYESMIGYLGAKPVPIPLVEERGFSFDLDVFRASLTGKTKMVILNSPQNPTGGIIPAEDIAAIADAVRDRNLIVLSDEIYSRIYYGNEKPVSIATMPGMAEKTIILDGFSKTYAMTGWRLGYGVMPEYLANAVSKLMVNSTSCTATFSQIAGVAALQRPAGRRRSHERRIPPPPRCLLPRAQQHPRLALRTPWRGLLRLRQRQGHRPILKGNRRRVTQRSGGRLPRRIRLRGIRQRLPALQLRQLVRQPHEGRRPNSLLGRKVILIGTRDQDLKAHLEAMEARLKEDGLTRWKRHALLAKPPPIRMKEHVEGIETKLPSAFSQWRRPPKSRPVSTAKTSVLSMHVSR